MAERTWEIGISGTFDEANYGDLLFPPIAEAELAERLGPLHLHRFSYRAKAPPGWPFRVDSLTALPELMRALDGMLIGGGFLIRFDKDVAPGYGPPSAAIHHPTGYWLGPALMALQNNVPVAWNSPGTDGKSIPAWAAPLMEMALTYSRYVSARDASSQAELERLTTRPVSLVPDTAFGIGRLLNLESAPSAGFSQFCEATGLDGPYVVVQPKRSMEPFAGFITRHQRQLRHLRFLILPIAPVHGDRHEIIDAALPGVVRPAFWPDPRVTAELIGRAEAVVGYSYHLSVTALASGVPVFARHGLPECKYSVLREFDTFFELPPLFDPDVDWFLARLGRGRPSAAARARQAALCNHWNRIADEFRNGGPPTAPQMNRIWLMLPGLYEEQAAAQSQAAETRRQLSEKKTSLENTIGEMSRQLTQAYASTRGREARIGEIMHSHSWRLAAPLRWAGTYLRRPTRRPLMNRASLRYRRLETDPYAWAAITNLFTPEDAERLAATYPCDHFKLVTRYDAERQYEYEARALIGMGERSVAYPGDLSGVWQKLAKELLSADYRQSMTALTGRDLSRAPMEVNVFHYGPGGCMDAHRDLPDKIVTHVLYFNRSWQASDGGCLRILRSSDPNDLAAEIPPLAGYSSIIVRSENSWHAVSQVACQALVSRRSVTVTFYQPGAVSTMWPPGDTTPLHRYGQGNA